MPETPQYYPRLSPISTGLACKCPRCGKGKMFKGYLTVSETCSNCGLDLTKADSGDGPAVFLMFILGALAVPAALWFELTFGPPLWLLALVGTVVILGAALALLRPMKGVMIAYQYHLKASEGGAESYDE